MPHTLAYLYRLYSVEEEHGLVSCVVVDNKLYPTIMYVVDGFTLMRVQSMELLGDVLFHYLDIDVI